MPDLPADICGLRHQPERDDRQKKHNGKIPVRYAFQGPPQPQAKPGKETGSLHERKRQEREIKHLARRAQKLGYTLTAVPATAPELPAESGGEGSF